MQPANHHIDEQETERIMELEQQAERERRLRLQQEQVPTDFYLISTVNINRHCINDEMMSTSC